VPRTLFIKICSGVTSPYRRDKTPTLPTLSDRLIINASSREHNFPAFSRRMTSDVTCYVIIAYVPTSSLRSPSVTKSWRNGRWLLRAQRSKGGAISSWIKIGFFA
jgi:hypothetical protein